MHRALLIHEIVASVADCLAEDISAGFPEKGVAQPALAVLARTCRAFCDPTLDALWRKLDNLEPLVLCVRTKGTYDDTEEGILPPFSDEEWSIMSRYASRVQEATLERKDHLSVKILRSLWYRTTPLLPNLRKLDWCYYDVAVTSNRLLLAPSLVHLHIRLEGVDHTAILGFLESYHILCPNLKSLHLDHISRLPHVMAAISRAIYLSSGLEALRCDLIDEAALIHIVHTRCLRVFSCDLHNHAPDTLERVAGYGSPNHPPFENLRVLDLAVQDLSSIIPYLKSQHQPFEEVTLRIDRVTTPGVVHEFFVALCSTTRRRSLRRIGLFNPYKLSVFGTFASSQPVNLEVLSPLMSMNLRWFRVNILNPISLNDDEFVRLIQGWPKLETLELNYGSGWDYPPSVQVPTLKGLLVLLARCPKLWDLGLCVDATNIPLLSEQESSIRNMAIRRLYVSNSPVQEQAVARVAHFLLQHIPSLTRVLVRPASGGRQIHYHQTWMKVDQKIKEIVGRRSPSWTR